MTGSKTSCPQPAATAKMADRISSHVVALVQIYGMDERLLCEFPDFKPIAPRPR